MSTTQDRSTGTSGKPGTGGAGMRLKVPVIPVPDADRGEEFYASPGRRLDADRRIGAAGPNWPDWYAPYMMAGQAETELPQ